MRRFQDGSATGGSGPFAFQSMENFPPGTELPKPPPMDLRNFPRWLRPVARRRLTKLEASRQERMEALRAAHFAR